MTGAIFFSGRYGSTAQYAQWIGEETGLPVFSIRDAKADPSAYRFFVLGSSVVFYRATIRKWVAANWPVVAGRPIILFTVSGAPPGPKLDHWITRSFPAEALAGIHRFALRGRLRHEDVSWWLKLALRIGAMFNRDPEAKRDEMHGFDYMDRSAIRPIVQRIRELQSGSGEATDRDQTEGGVTAQVVSNSPRTS